MNKIDCQTLDTHLDDWLDGQLDQVSEHAFEVHLAECADCAKVASQARGLGQALRQMPVPKMSPGFAERALRNARRADRPTVTQAPVGNWLAGFAGAAATASCFAIALWIWQPGGRANLEAGTQAQLQARTVALSVGEVQSMRLRIDAPRDFAQVNFSIDLPEHVQLAGQPGVRAITWKGQLNKGENLLELPLVAEALGSGTLAARVSWGEFERNISTSVVGVDANLHQQLRARGI